MANGMAGTNADWGKLKARGMIYYQRKKWIWMMAVCLFTEAGKQREREREKLKQFQASEYKKAKGRGRADRDSFAQ